VATLKKYNLKGKEIGKVELDDEFIAIEANGQMIKDYITAVRANARQWSASTKTRGEVSHSTKKPHRQKGMGRARQGSLVSPQFRGGGRVGTPKPKFDQHVRINKKERRAAIRFLIAEKIRENRFFIVDSIELDAPKTKAVTQFMKATQLDGKRVLFLGEGSFEEISVGDVSQKVSVYTDKFDNFNLSVRNIPKTQFALASAISGYDVAVAHDIVVTEAGFEELKNWLS
jgi:large subunit ribosomal protein L4